MADEAKLHTERAQANRASAILDNPMWREAWEFYESNLKAHMLDAKSDDETVLEARRMLLIMDKIKGHIESAVTTGKMAEMQLERIHGRKD